MGLAKVKTHTISSPEEYLAIERNAEFRSEYIEGEVYAMAGESLSHSRVYINLAAAAINALRGKPCEPLSPNMKVRTSTASLFAYPDMTIVCGEPLFHDRKKDVLINPKVIFEVLSPSTEKFDRTTKFQKYRMSNETLTDYVLISQDRPLVEHFSKAKDGNWVYRSYAEIANVLRIN